MAIDFPNNPENGNTFSASNGITYIYEDGRWLSVGSDFTFPVIPTGLITMWSGSAASIPSGWALCDGTNNTPDLRDRFLVGSGSTYSIGDTGGSADAVVVSHNHSITDPGHAHTYVPASGRNVSDGGVSGALPGSTTTGSQTTGITINSEGESGLGKNLPPYFSIAFIMKL